MEIKKLQIKPSLKLRGGVVTATGKLGQLQARIIRTSFVYGGIAAGAIILGLVMNSYNNSQQEEFSQLSGQINELNRQKQELETKFEKAKNSIDLYELIVKGSDEVDLSINPKKAEKLLTGLKDNYGLNTLRLEMSGIGAVQNQEFNTESTQLVSSEVNLNFTGINDEDLFAFLNGVMSGFTGFVRITDMNMERLQPVPIPSTVWQDIAAGKVPDMVSGRVKFMWFGIQNKPEALLKKAGAGQ